MDDIILLLLSILFHPVCLAFVFGGLVSTAFVAGTWWYYNRRGRGG